MKTLNVDSDVPQSLWTTEVSSSGLQKLIFRVYLFNPNLFDAQQLDGSRRAETEKKIRAGSLYSSRLSHEFPRCPPVDQILTGWPATFTGKSQRRKINCSSLVPGSSSSSSSSSWDPAASRAPRQIERTTQLRFTSLS